MSDVFFAPQWMTAGSGCLHEEMPHGAGVTHVTQLWLNLPRASKMVPPRYQDIKAATLPRLSRDGAEVLLYSGSLLGLTSPTLNVAPVTAARVTLAAGAALELGPLPASYNGFLYVLEGEALVGPLGAEKKVPKGHSALSEPLAGGSGISSSGGGGGKGEGGEGAPGAALAGSAPTALRVACPAGAREAVQLLAFFGEPSPCREEPVAMGGPFVMNTQAEIEQAFADYRSGKLR